MSNSGHGNCTVNVEELGNYTDPVTGNWVYVLQGAGTKGDNSNLEVIQLESGTISNIAVLP